jgi:hypothetical protein
MHFVFYYVMVTMTVIGKIYSTFNEKYGPDFDAIRDSIDPDVVYKVGCGKKHGHHFLADGYINLQVSASQNHLFVASVCFMMNWLRQTIQCMHNQFIKTSRNECKQPKWYAFR